MKPGDFIPGIGGTRRSAILEQFRNPVMRVPFSSVMAAAAALFAASCSERADSTPPPSHAEVRKLLDAQAAAWNRHDLDGFLAGYRKDEHVVFVTPEGSSRGYAELEQRYRKSYNAPEKFGELRFGDLEFTTVDAKSVLARGTWRLKREKDSPHGRFVLVVCQLVDGWRIVSDYTTVEETGG
jgi:ketosteroid isomerase-like protein